jgi:hypothetical protein
VGAALARARERGTAAPDSVDGEHQRLAEPAAEGDPARRGSW